jgi:c-di-GMP-binding flagellar brake protein YcgR
MTKPIVERRSHTRGSVAAIAVVWIDDRGPMRYSVEDLSAGGALLVAGPKLRVGDKLRMSLHIVGQAPIEMQAQVIRHADMQLPALGVAFREVSAADEDTIQQAVLRALESERRGESAGRLVAR